MLSKSIGMIGVVLALVVAMAVSLASPDLSSKPGKPVKRTDVAQAEGAGEAGQRTAAAAATAEEIQATANGNNEFAFRLLPHLRVSGQNLFFSSFSIRTAMAMMSAGAAGETLESLKTGLELSLDGDATHRAMAAFLARLRPAADKPYVLAVANSLWGQKDYGFLEAFVKTVREAYFGEVRDVDFVSQSEAVRLEINGWVEKNTAGLIRDLIPSGAVNAETKMVLVNAVYFKGQWATAFKKSDTREKSFRLSTGGDVKVPMMQRSEASELVAVGKGVRMMRLVYKGDAVGMDILLPDAADGLDAMIRDLSPERLAELNARLRYRDVNIELPRFSVRWGTAEISKALAELGMGDVLGGGDFSKVAKLGASITGIFHQAFVEVNEEGTEAAAATAIVAETGCAMAPEPPMEFKVDHPFMFLIRDLQNGAILFMGAVENPLA